MLYIDTIEKIIREKVEKHQRGLYIVILFPITISFILTFLGARVVSQAAPGLYLELSSGLHIHHFAWVGIPFLAMQGYLALCHNGPRAKFWLALLYGCGLGLVMDEFGIWVYLRADDHARWNYDGVIITIAAIVAILSSKYGYRFFTSMLSFTRKT